MQKGALTYLLDTDIVIWILRNYAPILDALEKLIHTDPLLISTITVAEVYKNIYIKETNQFDKLLALHAVIPVSVPVAKKAGLYWQAQNKQLKNLSITDCIIAATAHDQNAPLLTLNTRHFPMQDIRVMDPLRS